MKLSSPGAGIAGRFRIEGHLGSGGFGNTYAAVDDETGAKVAIKELDLSHLDDWKAFELFEREAATLERLDHPRIPDYVDFIPAEGQKSAYLVQELAPGSTLEMLLNAQGRFDEQRARQVAEQLLEILIYLDSRRPPVIHRDIKPANILADEEDQLYLVDFGSVANLASSSSQQNTVAGTFGYMAPEMLRGSVTTRADLFGAGMTLVHLVTARPPEDLPSRGLHVDFRPHAPGLSHHFAEFLTRMTEPDADQRFASAQRALEFLLGDAREPAAPAVEQKSAPRPTAQVRRQPHQAPKMSKRARREERKQKETQLLLDTPSATEKTRVSLVPLLRVALVATAAVIAFDALNPRIKDLLEHPFFANPVLFFLGPAASMILLLAFFAWVYFRSRVDCGESRDATATGTVEALGSYGAGDLVVFRFHHRKQRTFKQPLGGLHLNLEEFERAHPRGSKLIVRYESEDPKNATVLPDPSPLRYFVFDVVAGLLFSIPVVFAAYVQSLRLGDSFTRGTNPDGSISTRLGEQVSAEPLFFLDTTATAIWITICIVVLFLTLAADYLLRHKSLRNRVPASLRILAGAAALAVFVWQMGLFDPGTFFSDENVLHPDHPQRQLAE